MGDEVIPQERAGSHEGASMVARRSRCDADVAVFKDGASNLLPNHTL